MKQVGIPLSSKEKKKKKITCTNFVMFVCPDSYEKIIGNIMKFHITKAFNLTSYKFFLVLSNETTTEIEADNISYQSKITSKKFQVLGSFFFLLFYE